MNGAIDLGIVKPVFKRAEIVEVRKDNDRDWAVFRVPIGPGDQSQRVVVADCRPETVQAAREALDVSDKFYRARGKAKTELEDERVATLRAARTALNNGFADTMFTRTVIGGGRQEKISFALFPCDKSDLPISILALIHTTGRYSRYSTMGDERPLHFAKGPRGRQQYHDLHVVITDERPVFIWELNPSQPVLFAVSLEEGLVVQPYTLIVATEPTSELGETISESTTVPDRVAEVTSESTSPTPTKTRKKKVGNGKIKTVCPECEATVMVKAKDLAAGKAKCPECEVVLTSEA